jgi:hypothetical protein
MQHLTFVVLEVCLATRGRAIHFGTNSPFAALHKSGSYRGLICRAFTLTGPVSFGPQQTKAG